MSDYKSIGNRIRFSREKESISITISQRVKPWQEGLIFAWVAVWVICGFFFASQYFISDDEKQKVFIIAFMGFWSYLLFKALQILIWRLAGSEDIIISNKSLIYKKAYAGLGKARTTELKKISNLGLIRYSGKSFKKSYESYYWSIGAQKIGFNSDKRHMMIGMQLEDKDAKLLLELLNAGIKKYK